jgi:hypothetical protein
MLTPQLPLARPQVTTMLSRCLTLLAVAAAFAAATDPVLLDPVLLGTAGYHAILTKAGVSDTGVGTSITGDVAVSPIAATAITGFNLAADSSTTFSTSPKVVGKVYAASYTAPSPAELTTAVSDMEVAYTDAAGRTHGGSPTGSPVGPYLNHMAGVIDDDTAVADRIFTAGVYSWGTDVEIKADIVIKGSSTDIFLFQTSGNLLVSDGVLFNLVKGDGLSPDDNGPTAANIVWSVQKSVVVGKGAHVEGVLLVKEAVTLGVGASLNGRLFAQTRANLLGGNTIVEPASLRPARAGDESGTAETSTTSKTGTTNRNSFDNANPNTGMTIGIIVAFIALIAIGGGAYKYAKHRRVTAKTTKATLPLTNVAIAPADVTITEATPLSPVSHPARPRVGGFGTGGRGQ